MSTTPERTAEVAAAAAPYLESWLEHQRRRSRVPGVQAAVRVGDRLVLDNALGVADVTTGEPLTPGHPFRIAPPPSPPTTPLAPPPPPLPAGGGGPPASVWTTRSPPSCRRWPARRWPR